MYRYRATLRRILDGDTIDVFLELENSEEDLGFGILRRVQMIKKARIRFLGINTPETRTRDAAEKEKGLASKVRCAELLGPIGDEFKLIIETEKDKTGGFGRVLGRVFHESNQDKSINDILLEEGHAFVYKR